MGETAGRARDKELKLAITLEHAKRNDRTYFCLAEEHSITFVMAAQILYRPAVHIVSQRPKLNIAECQAVRERGELFKSEVLTTEC